MKILIIVMLFTMVSTGDSAVLTSEFEATLDSFIQTSMKCHYIPGMTLAIVKGMSKSYLIVCMSKTNYLGFRSGLKQTGLYSYGSRLKP